MHRMPKWWSPRRVALGLSANAAPSLVFVAIGVLLGPEALNVVSADALAHLDPVVSIALAVLGLFIGSGYAAAHGAAAHRWLIGSGVQAVVTLVTVVAAMHFLLARWGLPGAVDAWTAAGILGICSAASAAVRVPSAAPSSVVGAAQLANLDDVAIVILGSIAIPVLAGAASPLMALAMGVAAGLLIAVSGALLFSHAHNPPERGVFVIGSVLLLGGAAAYANASPLTTGAVAGLVWALNRRPTASLVDFELRRLQHPLVALLLIIAGLSIQFSYMLLWIAAPLVLFRLTGKLLASLIVARALRLPPGLVAMILVPPGILGIALALNVQQVLRTGDALLVSAVTVTVVMSEFLVFLLGIQEDEG